MWHFIKTGKNLEKRSENYQPTGIGPNLVKLGTFVFLGRLGSLKQPDYEIILNDFDRLLPLYVFVEGEDEVVPAFDMEEDWVIFHSGCPPRALWAEATLAQKQLDIHLRHSALQEVLYDELAAEFGADCVGTENWCRAGGRIDAFVRTTDVQQIYEIKTARTARGCIRDAVGQLLDYARWPGAAPITALIVVGEPPLTGGEKAYLNRLNARFPIPLEYRQVVLAK